MTKAATLDVYGMIGTLEDFLDATTPKTAPQTPEPLEIETRLAEIELALSQLGEQLKQQADVAAEAHSGLTDFGAALAQIERKADLLEALTSQQPQPQPQPAPEPETLVAQELEAEIVIAPAPPAAAPFPVPKAAASRGPSRSFLAALSVVLAATAALVPIEATKTGRLFFIGELQPSEAPVARQKAAPPAPAPSSAAAPDPEDDAMKIALAYRLPGASVTAGEILKSIAGDPLPRDSWEAKPSGKGRYAVTFVPYRNTLGASYSYRFAVDLAARQAFPSSETAERLRIDALGRLAGRSDSQAFWKLLDLSR